MVFKICKKCKQTISVKKIVALIFWDIDGIILFKFLSKDETVDFKQYVKIKKKLKSRI